MVETYSSMSLVMALYVARIVSSCFPHVVNVSALSICIALRAFIYIYILSVYSPFSDRVGLPLHNIHIPSPFPSIMDIFFVDLKFGHIRFYTL